MTKRKAITERMKIDALLDMAAAHYGGEESNIYCLECQRPILPGEKIQWDHRRALCHDGAHSYDNIRPVHADCHKHKSKRDVQANAKVKRIAKGGKTVKRPMQSLRWKPGIPYKDGDILTLSDGSKRVVRVPKQKIKSRGFQKKPDNYEYRWSRK